MRWYRVEVTELLPDGVSCITMYSMPEYLDSALRIFDEYKDLGFDLGEPKLVDLDVNPWDKELVAPGERNPHFFFGG